MGKKKHKRATSSEVIMTSIIEDFSIEENRDMTSEVKRRIPMLCTNGMACMIDDYQYVDTDWSSFGYQVASEMIQKYNKKLRKRRRKMNDYEFGGRENQYAKTDRRLIEVAQKGLDFGEYFAELSKDNYMYLSVCNKERDKYDCIGYTIAFIGKKWMKYKDEYYARLDEIRKIRNDEKNERIRFMNGKGNQTAIFKPFEQVIFRNKTEILGYIDNWKKNIPVYFDEYKMVSKLSILLYGPPGTGKSTFAKAVANYLGIETVTVVGPDYFRDSDSDTSNRRFRGMNYGMESVYTIDDIDCVCNSRENDHSSDNNTTMSNLLQFLDNPPTFYYKAGNDVHYPVSIVIATTNYMDRLDDAVKRYGRFDLKIEMENFSKVEAEEMAKIYNLDLKTLCPDCDTEGWTISPSYLQAKCLENVDQSLKSV